MRIQVGPLLIKAFANNGREIFLQKLLHNKILTKIHRQCRLDSGINYYFCVQLKWAFEPRKSLLNGLLHCRVLRNRNGLVNFFSFTGGQDPSGSPLRPRPFTCDSMTILLRHFVFSGHNQKPKLGIVEQINFISLN